MNRRTSPLVPISSATGDFLVTRAGGGRLALILGDPGDPAADTATSMLSAGVKRRPGAKTITDCGASDWLGPAPTDAVMPDPAEVSLVTINPAVPTAKAALGKVIWRVSPAPSMITPFLPSEEFPTHPLSDSGEISMGARRSVVGNLALADTR